MAVKHSKQKHVHVDVKHIQVTHGCVYSTSYMCVYIGLPCNPSVRVILNHIHGQCLRVQRLLIGEYTGEVTTAQNIISNNIHDVLFM